MWRGELRKDGGVAAKGINRPFAHARRVRVEIGRSGESRHWVLYTQ